MGGIEKEAKRKRQWGAFQRAMLAAVAAGGVMLIAATVPNAAQLLRYFPGYKRGAKFNFQAKSVLGRLVAKGLVTFVQEDGKRYARITGKGERVLQMEIERGSNAKKKKWDQRWRVVTFDIPEKRKNVRIRLRHFMHEYGFVRLQDSVWIYPHDCEDLIALVKADLRIGADVLYMIVERLERDAHLREHFSLPKEEK